MSGILAIQNLCAWYQKGKPVLSNLSITLNEHEIVGLIGLNGAGKTTFIKILSGLHSSFRTERIQQSECPVSFRNESFKQCRYTVFAEDHSFQYFTFWEYLSYAFAAYQKIIPDISGLIEGFHFDSYTDVLLKNLSTGNKKKVFLITAFALRPQLLLLDEPVNGLDFESTEFLYRLIAGYKAYGTLLFSSHVLESITLTSDRVLVLENGHIRQTFEGSQVQSTAIREALHYENHVSCNLGTII